MGPGKLCKFPLVY